MSPRHEYAAELVDRMAINDLYARYVHALDDEDWETLDDIFVPETVFDWTSIGYIRAEYPEVREVWQRNAELFLLHIHFCTNVLIDFEPGMERATVKSKTLNVSGMRLPDGEAKMAQAHGEYVDQLAERDGEWKILERIWHNQGSTTGAQLVEGSGGMLGN